jgi:hypothetical protein
MENDVEKLILDSLKEVIELKCIIDANNETTNRLVYPQKRGDLKRVSEQESRFLFIKKIENESDFFYSVEAPTKEKYYFTGKEENQRSGNFDVCLYGEDKKRKHLLEFKAMNPPDASYEKDFEKLMKDEEGLTNYFIQVIINSDNGTLPNIEKKYNNAIQYAVNKNKDNYKNSKLVIFLCNIGGKKIWKYEVIDFKLSFPQELYSSNQISLDSANK